MESEEVLPGGNMAAVARVGATVRRTAGPWTPQVHRLLAHLRARGIALAITTGANAAPVAELALALMLAVYRRIPYVNRAMREGRWPTPEMRETCFQIAGKTVGLVGFGHIGRMLARRLAGFDTCILYSDTVRADTATEERLRVRQVPLDELLARLRSIVRRSAGQASSVVRVGDVTLDERQMRVSVRGIPVTLSPLEYRLAAYLLLHCGRVVSQHELSENIYGQGDAHDSNAIEVLVGRVRKKLGTGLIETKRGFGYLVPEAAR